MIPFRKRIYLHTLGYDFVPAKQENKLFKVDVWKGESFLMTGKKEYKCWHTAINNTINVFYDKFKDTVK